MNRNMIYSLFIAFFMVSAVSTGLPMTDNQEKFDTCRKYLDTHTTDSCKYAQNIHVCAELLNMRLGSRENKELNRLQCKNSFKTCKESISKCTLMSSCSGLNTMSNCLYKRGCTAHFELLNNYYSDCYKKNCVSIDVTECKKTPLDKTDKAECQALVNQYKCVKNKQNYLQKECNMPIDWHKSYIKHDCVDRCYNHGKPNLDLETSNKLKCDELNQYNKTLVDRNCKMPDDMKTKYKELKCDTLCNERMCKSVSVFGSDRKEVCGYISEHINCLKTANCVNQEVHDRYSFFECGSSCDGVAAKPCTDNLKETVNSTRQEQCSYYKQIRSCHEDNRCNTDDEYYKFLECGAAGLSGMFSLIISVLLTVQMSERYISV